MRMSSDIPEDGLQAYMIFIRGKYVGSLYCTDRDIAIERGSIRFAAIGYIEPGDDSEVVALTPEEAI